MKNLIKIIILGVPLFFLLAYLATWFNLFVYMVFNIHLNYYVGLVLTTVIMGAIFWAYKGGKK
jgi:hypothetical protein